MSGTALTTSSPSRRRSRRSTPCVDGCCGPIDSVISDSSDWSSTSTVPGSLSITVLISSEKLTSIHAVRLVASQRVILSQRVPVEIRRQQYAAQIGMAIENDAEQIECLTLVPVGRLPKVRDRPHVGSVLTQ